MDIAGVEVRPERLYSEQKISVNVAIAKYLFVSIMELCSRT